MSQDEFIRNLEEALAGKVSDNIIRENTEYYRNYIREQMGQGRTEAEVLGMLGDPRLLAKTVAATQGFATEPRSATYQRSATNSQADYAEYYSAGTESSYSGDKPKPRARKLPTWLVIILGILVLVIVLRVALSLLSIFAPVIISVAVVLFAIKVLRNIFDS